MVLHSQALVVRTALLEVVKQEESCGTGHIALVLYRLLDLEGVVEEGQRILLVEDMTTDGRSKVNFCNALRDAGASVDHVFVIFYYDIFPDGPEILKEAGVNMHHLATWWDVLRVAKEENLFDTATLGEVEKYFNDPKAWSEAHGGVSEGKG